MRVLCIYYIYSSGTWMNKSGNNWSIVHSSIILIKDRRTKHCFGSRNKLDMKLNKIFIHNLNLDLPDRCAEVIVWCLELEILREKVEFSYIFFYFVNKISTYAFNIWGSRLHWILFDHYSSRTKSKLWRNILLSFISNLFLL